MSHSYIDPKNDYYNVNNDSDTPQKKIDPVAQLKWLNTPQVYGGWGLFHNPPAQMYAKDELNDNETGVQMKEIEDDTERQISTEGTQKDENPLSSNNQNFFTNVKSYIDEQLKTYNEKLVNLEADYNKKKWAIDKTKGNFKVFSDRITLLEESKVQIESIETIAKSKQTSGNDLLTLTNVVHNEAANYGEKAKTAVAYAYLNRIKYAGDGNIREPENNSEISDYSELNERWNNFISTSEKLEFLKNIKSSFDAANSRFESDGKTDPTNGATHWISPIGLESASGSDDTKSGYYPRNYSGVGWKFFPNWARSIEWVNKNPSDANKWFNVSEYKEIIATGVDAKEFLFYKGVKY